jgi:hypothetical protein
MFHEGRCWKIIDSKCLSDCHWTKSGVKLCHDLVCPIEKSFISGLNESRIISVKEEALRVSKKCVDYKPFINLGAGNVLLTQQTCLQRFVRATSRRSQQFFFQWRSMILLLNRLLLINL